MRVEPPGHTFAGSSQVSACVPISRRRIGNGTWVTMAASKRVSNHAISGGPAPARHTLNDRGASEIAAAGSRRSKPKRPYPEKPRSEVATNHRAARLKKPPEV